MTYFDKTERAKLIAFSPKHLLKICPVCNAETGNFCRTTEGCKFSNNMSHSLRGDGKRSK